MTRSELDAIAICNHLKLNGSMKVKQICLELGITPSRFQNCKVYLLRHCQRKRLVWTVDASYEIPQEAVEAPRFAPMTRWVGGNPFAQ